MLNAITQSQSEKANGDRHIVNAAAVCESGSEARAPAHESVCLASRTVRASQLAAAFHAPLAGVMFSLEEVHKNFSASVLVSAMTSALTADFLCSTVTGTDTVFQFEILQVLPPEHYALIVGLGVILGVFGAGYNWFTLKVQSWYRSIGPAGQTGKLLIPFLCAGVLGFTAPELLGTGHSLIEELTNTQMTMGAILFLLAGRFLFSAVSFGSGAPGGIFFPLLVIGGLTGGAYAQAAIQHLVEEAVARVVVVVGVAAKA